MKVRWHTSVPPAERSGCHGISRAAFHAAKYSCAARSRTSAMDDAPAWRLTPEKHLFPGQRLITLEAEDGHLLPTIPARAEAGSMIPQGGDPDGFQYYRSAEALARP